MNAPESDAFELVILPERPGFREWRHVVTGRLVTGFYRHANRPPTYATLGAHRPDAVPCCPGTFPASVRVVD